MLFRGTKLGRSSKCQTNWLFSSLVNFYELTSLEFKLMHDIVHTNYYWIASEASETLSGVASGNRRYIYIVYMVHETTVVVWARWYVICEELSVGHF